MASPSESKNTASDETEVTSKHQGHHHPDDDDERVAEIGEDPLLVRQSSIYSLTLDEIQNTVCEPGKHFGSMNMDEFLANIWSAEDAQPTDAGVPPPTLHRQGSIALPGPLCRKTVEEVWAEIHRDQTRPPPLHHHRQRVVDTPGASDAAHRQATFGEMTLEDFLIKAGVVRESSAATSQPPVPATTTPVQQQYGLPGYQMGAEGQGFGQVMGVGYGDNGNGVYQVSADGKRGGASGMCFGGGGGMGNGYGTPASPASDDGQVDNIGPYGGGGGTEARGGRKRSADGSVEKVVERRQRRMIKNRESAARSRARKQAYTVELEAELNQLKEENARLMEEQQRRVMALRKQVLLESMAERARANALKTNRTLRRCNSCPW